MMQLGNTTVRIFAPKNLSQKEIERPAEVDRAVAKESAFRSFLKFV